MHLCTQIICALIFITIIKIISFYINYYAIVFMVHLSFDQAQLSTRLIKLIFHKLLLLILYLIIKIQVH